MADSQFINSRSAYHDEYRRRYPERIAAHFAVLNALRAGELVRPDACEDCGRPGAVDGHHDDYSKPLSVRWLCGFCHAIADETRRRIEQFDSVGEEAVLDQRVYHGLAPVDCPR